MRIKSPFRDYYDSVQMYGDDEIVYARYPKTVTDVPLCANSKYNHGSINGGYRFKEVKIGFCGKLYTGYKFTKDGQDISKYLYTVIDLEKFYDKMGWDQQYDIIDRLCNVWKLSTRYSSNRSILYTAREAESKNINESKERTEEIYGWFKKYKTPIFVTTNDYENVRQPNKSYKRIYDVIVNGNLGNYDFQKVFNPQQTYQEIRMFLSNMGSLEKPIPYIDDVTMAEAKGFDKWSFRKEPANKK